MLTSSIPVKTLDLKKNSVSSKSEDISKKSDKNKDFNTELVEKQKRMKKKDNDLGPVQQSKSDRDDKSVSNKEEQKSSQGTKAKNKPISLDPLTGEMIMAKVSAEELTEQVAGEGSVETQDLSQTLESAEGKIALSDIESEDFARNLNGKMSLEGFKLVNPEALSQNMVVPEESAGTTPEEGVLESLKTLAQGPEAVQGKTEAHLKDLLSKHKEGGDSADLLGTNDLLGMNAGTVKENQQTSFAATLKAQNTEGLENIRQANVDNIVTQARTILKDGGGEMQVILNPDGLGTVDLKVGVDKGQVNVEILTQDKHVKKLFDDSILDIRHALEGHNLKVDTLKVGISDNFDAQQQMSQGQFDMMEREFARDFLGQFRDERQGFRANNLADRLNSGSPLSQNQPEGIKPAVRPMAANGRLNVVA